MSPLTKQLSKRWVVACAAACLIVLGVFAVRWWTHPTLFQDHGDGFAADPAPVSEAVLSVGVTYPPLQGKGLLVTFGGARAHLSDDSSPARITFSVCRNRPGVGPIVSAKGDDLSEFCSDVRPLRSGTRMSYSPARDGEYVIMTLRPTRPGKVRVDGVDLGYGHGWNRLLQRGTDPVAMDITLRTH